MLHAAALALQESPTTDAAAFAEERAARSVMMARAILTTKDFVADMISVQD